MMSSKYFVTLTVVLFCLMLSLPKAHSQIIVPTGNTTEASSQLVYWYDVWEGYSHIQVTNTNDTEGVWIHVQIFRNFDATGEGDLVICDERNFVDFLTPNDTHVYSLPNDNFPKNIGETPVAAGESTAIVDLDETVGFVVITPVISNVDLTAKSFEYLVGNTSEYSRTNAMGRSAVDFTTGSKVADNTPLDGITNGYEVLQPEELIFDFTGGEPNDNWVDLNFIVFEDVYGPPGLLGYEVRPGNATLTSFIFDFKESPTSCGIRNVECYLTVGLNDDFPQFSEIFWGAVENDLLCAGSSTPVYDPENDANFDNDHNQFGWTRIFVSGLGGFENMLGVLYEDNYSDTRWMNTQK